MARRLRIPSADGKWTVEDKTNCASSWLKALAQAREAAVDQINVAPLSRSHSHALPERWNGLRLRRSQIIVSQSSDRLLGRGFIGSFVALLDCPGTGGTVAVVAAIAVIKKQFRRVAEIDIYPMGYSFKYPPGYSGTKKMPDPIEDRQKLINRVRRLAGQIEALERAVENDAGFTEVMRLLTAGRGAINSIMAEVVEDHIQAHMLGRDRKPSRAEVEAAEELLDVLRSYIK